MAPHQAALQRLDPTYLAFAAAYSQYARAVYVFLSKSPRIMEDHRRGVIEMTKQTWALCKQYGIEEGRHAA